MRQARAAFLTKAGEAFDTLFSAIGSATSGAGTTRTTRGRTAGKAKRTTRTTRGRAGNKPGASTE